jgi:hypothetical protein
MLSMLGTLAAGMLVVADEVLTKARSSMPEQPLPPKWLALAAQLLEEASDQYSNHVCNDWDFPADWTIEERREFVRQMYEWNGNPEDIDQDHLDVPDFWVMGFLAEQLRKIVET